MNPIASVPKKSKQTSLSCKPPSWHAGCVSQGNKAARRWQGRGSASPLADVAMTLLRQKCPRKSSSSIRPGVSGHWPGSRTSICMGNGPWHETRTIPHCCVAHSMQPLATLTAILAICFPIWSVLSPVDDHGRRRNCLFDDTQDPDDLGLDKRLKWFNVSVNSPKVRMGLAID